MGSDDFHKKGKRNEFRRKIGNRTAYETFLVVCEGKETEPNYFRSFKVKSATIRVSGTGFNTLSLVKEAVSLKKNMIMIKPG